MSDSFRHETRTVRAAIDSDEQFGAVMPPIVLSTNFTFEGFGKPREYDYSRTANPTRDALAAAIADLEGGAGATVTASGMAAITLACQLLNPGDLVIAPVDCYGGTYRLLSRLAARGLFQVRFMDLADTGQLAAAEREPARLLWVESPTNPLLSVAIDKDLLVAFAPPVAARRRHIIRVQQVGHAAHIRTRAARHEEG